MNVQNPPKFYIVILALLCLVILMVTKTIESNEGVPIFTMIVGYAVGNGIAAKNGEPMEAIFTESEEHKAHREAQQ